MLEIAKYKDPILTGFSLGILQKILEASRNKILLFYNQIYLLEEESFRLSEFVRERRDKFFTLEYQNTTKINQNNQKTLYHMMSDEDSYKNGGIMQDCFMTTELMKDESKMIDWKF